MELDPRKGVCRKCRSGEVEKWRSGRCIGKLGNPAQV